MGCDIHVRFERRVNDQWEPLFEYRPEPNYWWERIIEKRIESEAVFVILGEPYDANNEDHYKKIEAYFEAMSLEEAEERYGNDPHFIWDYKMPVLEREPVQMGDRVYEWPEIDQRNYEWFGYIAGPGRCEHLTIFEQRGLPDDITLRTRQYVEQWRGDGHSKSWLMVDEILARPELKKFVQYRWLEKFIEDPANTRMIFFFDN